MLAKVFQFLPKASACPLSQTDWPVMGDTYAINDVPFQWGWLLISGRLVVRWRHLLLELRLRTHQVHLVMVVLFLVDIEYVGRVVDAESV